MWLQQVAVLWEMRKLSIFQYQALSAILIGLPDFWLRDTEAIRKVFLLLFYFFNVSSRRFLLQYLNDYGLSNYYVI